MKQVFSLLGKVKTLKHCNKALKFIILIEIQLYEEFQLALYIRDMVQHLYKYLLFV